MHVNRLVTTSLTPAVSLNLTRLYTCIVERIYKPNTMKKNKDQRKTKIRSNNFQYRLVECTHNKPWGNVDVILTKFVDGKFFQFVFSLRDDSILDRSVSLKAWAIKENWLMYLDTWPTMSSFQHNLPSIRPTSIWRCTRKIENPLRKSRKSRRLLQRHAKWSRNLCLRFQWTWTLNGSLLWITFELHSDIRLTLVLFNIFFVYIACYLYAFHWFK